MYRRIDAHPTPDTYYPLLVGAGMFDSLFLYSLHRQAISHLWLATRLGSAKFRIHYY